MQLIVGRIGRPHGVRGEVSVEVRTDVPEARFAIGTRLATDPCEVGPLHVTGARWHSGRLLLTLADVADREAAEALRGTMLVVEVGADERPEDPEEFYPHQLVGLRAVGISEVELGVVEAVVHLPGQDLLSVRTPEGAEVLVPFVAAIVPEVNLGAGLLRLDPPDGLFPATDPQAG